MQRLFTTLKARAGLDRAAFRNAALDRHAPQLSDAHPTISGLIVNLVDVDPGDAQWVRPGETPEPTDDPAYDVIFEVLAPGDQLAGIAAAIDAMLASSAEAIHHYIETPMPARVNRERPAGAGRSPGVKYIVLCRFKPDLPDAAAQRCWQHHVPLALKVHIGADIYIRHWVDGRLTPDAPIVQGITELHFPTWDDMRYRWFASDEARQQIIQDIGHFLDSGTRLYCSEYVLK